MPQPKGINRSTAQGLGHKRAKEMYASTIANQGGTFTTYGMPIRPPHGFVVSLDPDRGIVVPMREFSPTTLEVFAMNQQPYMIDYNQEMPTHLRGLKFFGTWVFGEEVHIDVVTVIVTKDVDAVIDLARQNNQVAVWDFSTGKEIFCEQYAGQLV